MRTKKAIYSILVSGLQQIILMVLGLILPRLYISAFGSEMNGLISSIKQFLGYFMIAGAGIGAASVAALFKPLGNKDTEGINKVLSATNIFYKQALYIFLSFVFIMAIVYPYLIPDNVSSGMIISLVLILGIGSTIEQFITAKYTVLLMADQKAYINSGIQTVTNILNALFIIIFIKLGFGILITQIIATVVVGIKFIIIYSYINTKYPQVRYNVETNMSYIENRWQAFFYQISGMVISYSPIAIITMFCGLKEVSVYTIYNLIFSSLAMIVGIFSYGLTSGFGDMIAKKEKNNLINNFNTYEFFYYVIIAIIYSITFLLLDSFIAIYTIGINDINYVRPIFGILFVINGILKNMKTPHITLIDAGGYFKENNIYNIVEAIICILLSLLLVNNLGMNGVLIGLSVGYLFRIFHYIRFTQHKILNSSKVKESYRLIIINIVLAVLGICISKSLIAYNSINFILWIISAIKTTITISLIIIGGNFIFNKKYSLELIKKIKIFSRKK